MNKFTLLMSVFGLGLGVLPIGCAATGGDGGEAVASDQAELNGCYTNYGLNPTKAALAIAMANELGRWDPAHDLRIVSGNTMGPYQGGTVVALSSTAVCIKNNCKNTKALLGQQDERLTSVIDQNVFSPTNYHTDLESSMERSSNFLSDIQRNNPSKMPPAHKLTLVGGPTNLGVGACGPHYVFQADHTNGTPLTTAEAQNLGNGLCFFGFANCGNGNPYLKYTVTGQGCPTGRTCVAVDPTDGDNGSGTTTTSGSSPTYPLNRLYDPSNTKLNSSCTTTGTKYGSMASRCSAIPSTCGYLYCVAN